ncbi:Transposase [Escherichia coli]
MSHAVDGTYIKAQQDKMVNSSLCKKASVDTYVMEVNLIIYNDDVIMMN